MIDVCACSVCYLYLPLPSADLLAMGLWELCTVVARIYEYSGTSSINPLSWNGVQVWSYSLYTERSTIFASSPDKKHRNFIAALSSSKGAHMQPLVRLTLILLTASPSTFVGLSFDRVHMNLTGFESYHSGLGFYAATKRRTFSFLRYVILWFLKVIHSNEKSGWLYGTNSALLRSFTWVNAADKEVCHCIAAPKECKYGTNNWRSRGPRDLWFDNWKSDVAIKDLALR